MGRSKHLLNFLLAKGTTEETTIQYIVIIADTDAYNFILGTDFLGRCFGYLDPPTKDFLWRVDDHEIESMPTRLARLPD